jgi:DNA polymerase III delta prime subunit
MAGGYFFAGRKNMATYYVGGTNLYNRFDNLEAAVGRAEDGDIIELNTDVYGIAISINKKIAIKGNGHTITPKTDNPANVALSCNAFVTIDDIVFECRPKTVALRLFHGGNLTKITTRIKGPAAILFPTLFHYGEMLTLEECDIMMMHAAYPKDSNGTLVTEIKRSVIKDYYGGCAFINRGINSSFFQGETNISDSILMSCNFFGNATLSQCILMNFNLVCKPCTMHLISCTLNAHKGEIENRENEPTDGPLKDMMSVPPFALGINGNVIVENYSSNVENKCMGFYMLTPDSSMEIRNTIVESNHAAHHMIKGGTVKFTNVTDHSRYLFSNAQYFLVNSKINVVNSKINVCSDTKTAMDELNEMIGLDSVKKQLRTILNTIKINQQHPEKDYGFSHHMVFAGDPGTGKTTVAKLVAKALYEIGAIPENKCMEVPASQLIKGYIGQTGEHVEQVMQSALGGVVFIDEAYELMVRENMNSYNGEALAVLLRYMEDNRKDLVVIAAGYEKEMKEFLASNVGLTRRFQWISFEDYTPSEMADIFMLMSNRYQETYDAEIEDPHGILEDCFVKLTDFYLSHPDANGRVTNGGNGGLVRNLFQQVIFERNNRVVETGESSMDIKLSDIRSAFHEEMDKANKVMT